MDAAKILDAPYEIFQKKSNDDEALACGRMLLCLSQNLRGL
jgi:hypothetical protein